MTFALAFITQDQNSVFMSASLIQQLQYEWQVEMVKKLHVRKNDPYESSKKTTKKHCTFTLHNHTLPQCSMSLKEDIIKRTKCHKCWELAEHSLKLGVIFTMKIFVMVNRHSCWNFTGSNHCVTFITTSIEKLTLLLVPLELFFSFLFFYSF